MIQRCGAQADLITDCIKYLAGILTEMVQKYVRTKLPQTEELHLYFLGECKD